MLNPEDLPSKISLPLSVEERQVDALERIAEALEIVAQCIIRFDPIARRAVIDYNQRHYDQPTERGNS